MTAGALVLVVLRHSRREAAEVSKAEVLRGPYVGPPCPVSTAVAPLSYLTSPLLQCNLNPTGCTRVWAVWQTSKPLTTMAFLLFCFVFKSKHLPANFCELKQNKNPASSPPALPISTHSGCLQLSPCPSASCWSTRRCTAHLQRAGTACPCRGCVLPLAPPGHLCSPGWGPTEPLLSPEAGHSMATAGTGG